MDTKQLITFVTLSEVNNYIKAAERLSYAPSTLAKHIQSLETELHVKLVEYRDNKIHLTADGKRFYAYAVKMLETYWEATEAFSGESQLSGTIRIAGGEPIVGFSLSPLFLDFSTQYPQVAVNVQMICCARVPVWLRNREVDLGYIHEMEILKSDGYVSIPLYNEPICLVTTVDHPLAVAGKPVFYGDLQSQKFAFTYDDCCFTMAFRNRMQKEDVIPESELFLGSLSAVLNSVIQDHRIALIPYSAVPKLQNEKLVCLNWQDEPIRPWVQIIYDANHRLSAAEKEMIREAQCFAADQMEQDKEKQLYA